MFYRAEPGYMANRIADVAIEAPEENLICNKHERHVSIARIADAKRVIHKRKASFLRWPHDQSAILEWTL
jgi:hypothetical protein